MKTLKGSGRQYTENRQELMERYLPTSAVMKLKSYDEGNSALISLLSDVQASIQFEAGTEEPTYMSELLNDIKLVLMKDKRHKDAVKADELERG